MEKLIEDIVRLTVTYGMTLNPYFSSFQIEITEQLLKAESSMHALSALGHAQRAQKHEHDSSFFKERYSGKPSGTYAKPC